MGLFWGKSQFACLRPEDICSGSSSLARVDASGFVARGAEGARFTSPEGGIVDNISPLPESVAGPPASPCRDGVGPCLSGGGFSGNLGLT
jgi:hypothetical protein